MENPIELKDLDREQRIKFYCKVLNITPNELIQTFGGVPCNIEVFDKCGECTACEKIFTDPEKDGYPISLEETYNCDICAYRGDDFNCPRYGESCSQWTGNDN